MPVAEFVIRIPRVSVAVSEAELTEFLEQLMSRKNIGLLPFVDKGIDFGGDELLQDAARFVVVGGEEHF